jgi:RNA polymerase sigma-70 factor (ECF subfamily)
MSSGEKEDLLLPAPRPASGGDGSDDALELPAAMRDQVVRELIDRAQSGDAEAMNELFGAHYPTMVELARLRLGPRLRSKEEADDLAQTTFREAVRDFHQYEYRGEGSLLSWLIQILQNKIRDKAEYYAAGKRDVAREFSVESTRRAEDEATAFEPTSRDLTVTRVVQLNEEFEILRQAMRELSPDHRKAIALVFFKGMSLRQAGERMEGRSEDAVRMLLRRAEGRLRELTKARLGK